MAKLMAFRWPGRLKVTVATGGLESRRMWSFNAMIPSILLAGTHLW
jgi:hypothetical protein